MPEKKKGKPRQFVIKCERPNPMEKVLLRKPAVSSKQIRDQRKWMSEHNLVETPYPLDALLTLYESCSTFMICVNQVAKDVAGLGYSLQLVEGEVEDKVELERAKEALRTWTGVTPLRTFINSLVVDWGALGNFYIEVAYDTNNKVAALYRLPAHTVRVRSDHKAFCQIRNEKRVWFHPYGGQCINSKTGKPESEDEKNDSNAIIAYRQPYPRSDYYGVPQIIGALGDVVGLIASRDYNLDFFNNFGVPAGIITLTGDWEEGSERTIRNFFTTMFKGSGNHHRMLVMSNEEEAKVEIKQLDEAKVKEASFSTYEKQRKENVLAAYSMPPERVGIRIVGSLGGNVAEEATKIYVQGVVRPLQQDIENVVNDLLLRQGYGISKYVFKFDDLDYRNMSAITERQVKQVEHGIITPNQARNEIGKAPYQGGDAYYMLGNVLELGIDDTSPTSDNQTSLENDFDAWNDQRTQQSTPKS